MARRRALENLKIAGHSPLPSPEEIQRLFPVTQAAEKTVRAARAALKDILEGRDRRLFLVVGPCSIHDPKAALEYARRLRALSERVSDRFLIAMRVYFEKPRTTLGWKGYINDPFMNDSFHIEEGLKRARQLLLKITGLGLPAATEALDPVTPQYLGELVSWYAIGARTIESQTHREMASGLSAPIGFKNGTDGNIQVAINAMRSALSPHHFLGVDARGRISVYRTRGNPESHVVLRGGAKPNYDPASIARCRRALSAAGLKSRIMVDCSHGNSSKDHRRQAEVFNAVLAQAAGGDRSILGMMLESNLHAGNQPIAASGTRGGRLKYGVSVTDACIGWETTERIILAAYRRLGAG